MQIAADKLKLTYHDQTLFENLSFSANSGQKICIAGPSGSGKTSLLRAFMGFVQPAAGSIAIDGVALNEKTVWKLRRHIAYVPQEPDIGTSLVRERIHQPFGLKANAHVKLDIDELNSYWQQFGLSAALMDKPAGLLSGGEKQRVAVIVALLLKRPILLLDEPVSAMDKQSRQMLRQVLERSSDKTVIFVSHDEFLLDIADKIIDIASWRSSK